MQTLSVIKELTVMTETFFWFIVKPYPAFIIFVLNTLVLVYEHYWFIQLVYVDKQQDIIGEII